VTSGEIDRTAIKAYKANLSILASRYGDLERRVLEHFVQNEDAREITIDLGHSILLQYLVDDGLLEHAGPGYGALIFARESDPHREPGKIADTDLAFGPASWRLTDDGLAVVERLLSAREIE